MPIEDRFKSPQHAARFFAAYDTVMALWKIPYETMDIPTRLGMTHVHAAGLPDATPLILLHGAQMSSTVWYPNIEALSRQFRVYAPDIVNQIGRSVPGRALKTRQDCADWLTDLLDALHLERATIIGHSQGGWLTLNLAIMAPQRVERMILLAPAPALASLRWQLIFRFLPMFIIPTRGMFYRGFQGLTTMRLGNQHPMIDQLFVATRAFKPQELNLGVATVFTDEELRQVNIPTLLLIGDHEVIYDPRAALERARMVMPHIEAALIPNGGHLFPVDQADATNARILTFLKG